VLRPAWPPSFSRLASRPLRRIVCSQTEDRVRGGGCET